MLCLLQRLYTRHDKQPCDGGHTLDSSRTRTALWIPGIPSDTYLSLSGHCQLNAKNMHISAAARKPPLVFFLHDRLYFRPLYPVSFPHGERVCERFFIKLTKPVEVLIAFGTFSVISLWLYWSRIGPLLHQVEDSHS